MTDNSKTLGQLLFEKLDINYDKVSLEQLPHYTAIEYFLTIEDEPDSNARNLDKVNRYLESFHHLCEVEDWNRGNQIITYRLDIFNQEQLHNQLGIWGEYREQINLYSKLLNKLNESSNFIILKGLGNAYQSLSEYSNAINCFEQSLLTGLKQS
jgi:tetratricopeptide (TPR) repeat protein